MTVPLHSIPRDLRALFTYRGPAPRNTRDRTVMIGDAEVTLFIARERWTAPRDTLAAAVGVDLRVWCARARVREVSPTCCPHCGDVAWLPAAHLARLRGQEIICGICQGEYRVDVPSAPRS